MQHPFPQKKQLHVRLTFYSRIETEEVCTPRSSPAERGVEVLSKQKQALAGIEEAAKPAAMPRSSPLPQHSATTPQKPPAPLRLPGLGLPRFHHANLPRTDSSMQTTATSSVNSSQLPVSPRSQLQQRSDAVEAVVHSQRNFTIPQPAIAQANAVETGQSSLPRVEHKVRPRSSERGEQAHQGHQDEYSKFGAYQLPTISRRSQAPSDPSVRRASSASALSSSCGQKDMLPQSRDNLPESPKVSRQDTIADTARIEESDDILAASKWTKIDRRVVNPQALGEMGERFEERQEHVIVLRVMTKAEIQKVADRTHEIRGMLYGCSMWKSRADM